MPPWAVTVSILASIALGLSAAVLVHTLGGIALTASMADRAVAYVAAIWQKREWRDAFSFAVTLSRADIAWIFIAQLFPLTSSLPARLMTALCITLRSFLSAMAIVAAVLSAQSLMQGISAASCVAAGLVFTLVSLRHAFVSADGSASLRTSLCGIACACACSGGVIFFRSLILAAVGAVIM